MNCEVCPYLCTEHRTVNSTIMTTPYEDCLTIKTLFGPKHFISLYLGLPSKFIPLLRQLLISPNCCLTSRTIFESE